MNYENEFGKFVEMTRKGKGFTLRGFADATDIAPAYMSDLEKGHRPPPSPDKLEVMAIKLKLSQSQKDQMFDLAGKARENNVSPDLPKYIMDDSLSNVRVALRMARDMNADNDVWQDVIKILEERKRQEN